MLDSRYLYLHEALDLGPMWLNRSARLYEEHAQPAAAQPDTSATIQAARQTPTADANHSPNPMPRPQPPQAAHAQMRQILQQLNAPTHTARHISDNGAETVARDTAPPAHGSGHTLPEQPVVPQDIAALPEAVAACTACTLHLERRRALTGHGAVPAQLMVVSPNPAPDDDLAQRLFSGDVGKLLHNMLAAAGIDSTDVFFTSWVKCTPHLTLRPQDEHRRACLPYLQQQVAAVRPRAVLLIGRSFAQMDEARLRQHFANLPYVITPHPAVLLRHPQLKAQAWAQLRRLKTLLTGA